MRNLLAIVLALATISIANAEEANPLDAYPKSDALAANLAWHKQTAENEIWTSWFLHGKPGIAMICTANLNTYQVMTSREVYNHASQSTKTRELSHAQALTLAKLVKNLPASAKAPELENLLLVSIRDNDKVKTFRYDRSNLPPEIVRLFDLTGAYLDTP
jgi:hypothetical protein